MQKILKRTSPDSFIKVYHTIKRSPPHTHPSPQLNWYPKDPLLLSAPLLLPPTSDWRTDKRRPRLLSVGNAERTDTVKTHFPPSSPTLRLLPLMVWQEKWERFLAHGKPESSTANRQVALEISSWELMGTMYT